MAFYQLLLVAALIAASNATLDDEIIPEDNQFISVDDSAGDQTTAGGQTAQEMEGIEAETDSSESCPDWSAAVQEEMAQIETSTQKQDLVGKLQALTRDVEAMTVVTPTPPPTPPPPSPAPTYNTMPFGQCKLDRTTTKDQCTNHDDFKGEIAESDKPKGCYRFDQTEVHSSPSKDLFMTDESGMYWNSEGRDDDPRDLKLGWSTTETTESWTYMSFWKKTADVRRSGFNKAVCAGECRPLTEAECKQRADYIDGVPGGWLLRSSAPELKSLYDDPVLLQSSMTTNLQEFDEQLGCIQDTYWPSGCFHFEYNNDTAHHVVGDALYTDKDVLSEQGTFDGALAHRRLLGDNHWNQEDFVRPGIRLEAQTGSRFTGTYWNPSKTSTVGVGNTRFGTTVTFNRAKLRMDSTMTAKDKIDGEFKIVAYAEPIAQVPVIHGVPWTEKRTRHLDGEISDVENGCKWTDRAALDTVKFFREKAMKSANKFGWLHGRETMTYRDDEWDLRPYEVDVYASIMGLVGDEGYRKLRNNTNLGYKLTWRELGRGVAGYTQQVTDCLRNPSEAL